MIKLLKGSFLKNIHFFNTGVVGKTLARLFYQANVTIGFVHNRNKKDANHSKAYIGAGTSIDDLNFANNFKICPGDVFILATTDDHIQTACQHIARRALNFSGVTVCHLSGTLSSKLLFPLKTYGAQIASVHPIKSFPDPHTAAATFSGTFCAIEGDNLALNTLQPLLEKINARVFKINAKDKIRYHAACVMASNLSVVPLNQIILQNNISLLEITLKQIFEDTCDLFQQSGIPLKTAQILTRMLIKGTMINLKNLKDPQKALTGPLKEVIIK